MRIELLDHGYVEVVESWGSDERIIEAARMSTAKGFQGWGPYYECPSCKRRWEAESVFGEGGKYFSPDLAEFVCSCKHKGLKEVAGDEKLLRFLYENKHATPFEMAGLVIEVQAPIFVFREWHRHRTQSYNELSARYTELPDMFYVPSMERVMAGKQSTKNKQGSEGGFDSNAAENLQNVIYDTLKLSRERYEFLLSFGLSRELARLVIPVAQYSRMRASANLRNWLQFLTLRIAQGAQWEIRQYAEVVGRIVEEKFPRTWELFMENK